MTAGITSVGYAGTVSPGVAWKDMQYALGVVPHYVHYWTHLTPTMVSGGTRQVSIGTGACGGWGIKDQFTTAQTKSLPVPGGASEFFLIVVRRTWGTTNETSVEYVSAGTTLPTSVNDIANRNKTPGVLDDQPICLVRVDLNDSLPKLIYDLRMIGGKDSFLMAPGTPPGFFLSEAASRGTMIRCGSVTYRNRPTADGLFWEPDPYIITSGPGKGDPIGIGVGDGGWALDSKLDCVAARSPSSGNHQLRLQASRTGADLTFTSGTGAVSGGDVKVCKISNADFQPPYTLSAMGTYRTSTGTTYNCGVTFSPDGSVTVTAGAQGTSIGKRTDGAWSLWVNFEWIS